MRLLVKKSFRKQFKKLPFQVRQQFRERSALFIENKFDIRLNNHSVGSAYPNCRSINVTGDYRAIFYEDGDIAIFIAIGTHAQLY